MAANLASNVAQGMMGDAPTAITNDPATSNSETYLALEWHGKYDVRMNSVPKR